MRVHTPSNNFVGTKPPQGAGVWTRLRIKHYAYAAFCVDGITTVDEMAIVAEMAATTIGVGSTRQNKHNDCRQQRRQSQE
jgi:hypothetical protein